MALAYPLSAETAQYVKLKLDGQFSGMDQTRRSFWTHWARLAEVFLPRRYKWFITPNQYNRGGQINQSIIDETGVIAARTLSAGMMSGLTSPTRPWFRLALHDLAYIDYGPVKNWLSECERRMMKVLAQSNFYQALGTLYHDNGVFGSASMLIYEDPDQVIRCYNPCLGEFYFDLGPRLDVNVLAREFTLTVRQTVEMFGLENVSTSTAQAYKAGGAQLAREVVIRHIIEPNTRLYGQDQKPMEWVVPPKFAYREIYYERGSSDATNPLLSCAGFNEKPFVGARWDTVSNDPYGRSPGMDAMPATLQLQIEQRRKAEAIDKLVRPPMNASVNMRNEPASILPGAINYVTNIADAGFKPAYQVDPRIAEMMQDIIEVQNRIKSVFFVDLFLMISNLQTVRTATEIDARREEKLIQLGPVIERFENEVLDPIIDRVFAIMSRRGLLPPPPQEIAGAEINVQYISMLAEAQRAASTAAIERVFQLTGNLAALIPDVTDNIDWDKGIDRYADYLNVDPEIIRPSVEVAAIRKQKAQQAQAEQAAQATLAGVQAAQQLSATKVGGGENALDYVLGNA